VAFGAQHLPGTHDPGPLEYGEQREVGIRSILAANVGLTLERRLHRLECAAEPPQGIFAACAHLLQRLLQDALEHAPDVLVVRRVDPFMNVSHDDGQHRRNEVAIHPDAEALRHAAADAAAEERGRSGIAQLQMLGDFQESRTTVSPSRIIALSCRRKKQWPLVAHAHRCVSNASRLWVSAIRVRQENRL